MSAPEPAPAIVVKKAANLPEAAWQPGDWKLFDGNFASKQPVVVGNGCASLTAALTSNTLYWGMYQYNEQYCVRIKWRPAGVSALKKVKANQSEQSFLDFAGDKTKVTVEVLGVKNFNDNTLWECIRPGSGIKTIDD